MHSSLVRVQNVFGFFTSAAFAVAAAIAVSVILCQQAPSASLELKNIKVAKGRPHYYSTKREEYAHVTFDLDADLSSLFNWNTKQIFVYITATYASTSPATIPPSEAIIWDAIIPAANAPTHPNRYAHPQALKSGKKSTSKSALTHPRGATPGILRLQDQKPKYQITDFTGKIAERGNATLTLGWNVQPYVGVLTWTNRATYGVWKGLKGGVSETFTFPGLKSGEGVKKADLETEKGREKHRLMAGQEQPVGGSGR